MLLGQQSPINSHLFVLHKTALFFSILTDGFPIKRMDCIREVQMGGNRESHLEIRSSEMCSEQDYRYQGGMEL